MKTYIYIFEDGTVQQHQEGPTPEDLQCVEGGMLIVLECDGDVKYLDADGQRSNLEQCELSYEIEYGSFHQQV